MKNGYEADRGLMLLAAVMVGSSVALSEVARCLYAFARNQNHQVRAYTHSRQPIAANAAKPKPMMM